MGRRLLLLAIPALCLAGCLSVTPRSDLEALEARLTDLSSRREKEANRLDERVRRTEDAATRLEGMLAGVQAAAGPREPDTSAPAAGTGPGTRPGPGSGSGTGSGSGSGSGSGRPPRDHRRTGGILRTALPTDPPTLDPALLQDTTSHLVAIQILECLVELDAQLRIQPRLATAWTISEDGLEYRFELRPGVRFHHGREMTAEDFVWSFRRILDPATASVRVWILDRVLGYPVFARLRRSADLLRKALAGEIPDAASRSEALASLSGLDARTFVDLGHPDPERVSSLADRLSAWLAIPDDATSGLLTELDALEVEDFVSRGIQAPDPHTLVLRLERPFAPFLQVLAMVQAAVLPREEVERLGSGFAFQPVGTGPFRFHSWEHDVRIELRSFDGYYGGRPPLEGITFRILPDDVARLTEFLVGNLDVSSRVPDEKYVALRADPDFPGVLEEVPILHVLYLAMNPTRPPFTDRRVRRAFNHAIDRVSILEKIRKGRGILAEGPLSPGIPEYDPELRGYEYSPEKAVALLREAGYDPPSKLGSVEFWFNSSTGSDVNAKIAEVFQENLRKIGVDLVLQSVEWGTYLQKLRRCEPSLLRLAWVSSIADGDGFLYPFFHSSSIGQTNVACYSDPAMDDLLDRARESRDPEERIRLYRQATSKVVEEAIWIPLLHNREDLVRKPWVRDLVLSARGADAVRFRDVWLAPRP